MASSIKPFLDSAKERMAKSVEHFQAESRGIRTGRATSGLVDNIRVDYYGTKTPLNQLASVSVPEPRQLMVKPFDVNAVKDIEKAILASDLGLNPSIDGKALRISIPPLSEEQRMKLVSRVKSLAEEARVSMRNVRRDVLKEVETAQKDKGRSVSVTEDDVRQAKDEIQALLKSQEA
ncbi:MAG: ribosome recycling factor, partial [Planctomycetes bacterium]|nr:ribosome recycling factor [Planctomycetota bacterium]